MGTGSEISLRSGARAGWRFVNHRSGLEDPSSLLPGGDHGAFGQIGRTRYSRSMSFLVSADAYDRFMGRYSSRLSGPMCDLAGVRSGDRVLDVGCGPGVLTRELVRRLGAERVSAVDPSDSFVEAARGRLPGVDVHPGSAEALPFEAGAFDAALAQLVVQFMADPVGGVAEMRRVVRPGGVVAACVWDHGGGAGPLGLFWDTARRLDPGVEGEQGMTGVHRGDLERLFHAGGLRDVEEVALTVEVEHADFDEWWEPYSLGVGPAGSYVAGLSDGARETLRLACLERLGAGPFPIVAVAWAARGVA